MGQSITDIRDQLQRARGKIKGMRSETEAATKRIVQGTMIIAGGGAVGLMRGMWEGATVPGTDVDYETAIAATLTIVGVLDGAGDYSDELGAIGAGMGAAIVAPTIEGAIKRARAEKGNA